MKRSEMVDILIQADKDADKELGIGCSLYNYFSFILDRAEEAGMLPPSIDIDAEETLFVREVISDSIWKDSEMPYHQWEPEDEA